MPSTYFSNRHAWTIEAELIRASILQCGGHLAEVSLKDGVGINPLWIQSRPTIDSDTYDPAIHGQLYGHGPEARLLSGLAGHNLCFPFWGNPTPTEIAAGMTYHGETNIRRWHCIQELPGETTLEVQLPESAMTLQRRFRCEGHVLHIESQATNLSSWDRPFGWCEHVTMGPPFVEAGLIRFDASLSRGFVTADADGPSFPWPEGMNPQLGPRRFDLTGFSPLRHNNLVNSFLVEPPREWGFFTAFHPRFALIFGYVFPRSEFPWLNVWENNDERSQARGMEFSNTPHHGTMKTLIRSHEVWDVPAYEWLDARSTVSKRFMAFLHPVPPDFRGTADVRVLGDALEIEELGTARTFRVPVS
jgi:hypothetical protein